MMSLKPIYQTQRQLTTAAEAMQISDVADLFWAD